MAQRRRSECKNLIAPVMPTGTRRSRVKRRHLPVATARSLDSLRSLKMTEFTGWLGMTEFIESLEMTEFTRSLEMTGFVVAEQGAAE